MIIEILTLFPEFYASILNRSIISRALKRGIVKVNLHDLRKFSSNKHNKVDDTPYGGGEGMVLQFPPIYDAIMKLKDDNTKVYLLSPQGKKYNHDFAMEMSKFKKIILICGYYEGVDSRVEKIIDAEISVGDYILTNGDIASMLIVDSLIRLLPGVINKESVKKDTFYSGKIKYPQYTKPSSYKGYKVPEVLLSGDHGKIAEWRESKIKEITEKKRPDLNK